MKKLAQSLSITELSNLVSKQINTFIPDPSPVLPEDFIKSVPCALERMFFCFSAIKLPYYNTVTKDTCVFNHLNSDHYCSFLYFLMNSAYKDENREDLATKIFLLNKCLHGIDLFFTVELPDIFLFVHPLGTIIGKATYKNFTVFYQNVTIGSTPDGIYPKFGEKTIFYAKSTVIGDVKVEDNVIFSANSFLMNTNVPSNTIVVGAYPNNKMLINNTPILDNIFITPPHSLF